MSNLLYIKSHSDLMVARDHWNAVAGQKPFQRWEWLANWAKTLGAEQELSIMVQRDYDQNWLGIAPFVTRVTRTGARKLEFLGSGEACSDYASLIARPGHEESFAEFTADWLSSAFGSDHFTGGYDMIELDGVADNDPMIESLCDRLGACKFTYSKRELEGCWATELPETWPDLKASFSKSLRRKVNASLRLLDSDETRVISSCEVGVRSLWSTFVDLHQQRREMLEQPGCFADSAFEQFLYGAATSLANDDLAEIVVIEYQGKPLASMIAFNDGENTLMYQTGFDISRLDMCPGYLLITHCLKDAIAKGRSTYDFLRGDEPYKSRWKTKRVPMVRIRLVPPKLSSSIRHNSEQLARNAKKVLKKAKPRTRLHRLLGAARTMFAAGLQNN